MKRLARQISAGLLCALVIGGVVGLSVTRYSYAAQFREIPNAPPSASHFLGTDALGRDLFTRLLYGASVSLLLAPAAALISTLLAGLLGSFAGWEGGWWEKVILAVADLSLALPLMFVLLALRALLPLDISPAASAMATFTLLGLLGWPSALRVIWAHTQSLRNSDFLLLAEAGGCRRWRIVTQHLLPNLRAVMLAQFWIAIPVFILTEATLSMLGLGVLEPLPSLGNLLRGLENFSSVTANPWRLAPLILLVLIVVCLQLALPAQEETA
jgi:peptide/nickel transport system permease protein